MDFNRVVIAPLDVVKIRMQLQTHRTHFGFKRQQVSTTTISPNVKYSKISQALKTILKEEGIRVKKTLKIQSIDLCYLCIKKIRGYIKEICQQNIFICHIVQ